MSFSSLNNFNFNNPQIVCKTTSMLLVAALLFIPLHNTRAQSANQPSNTVPASIDSLVLGKALVRELKHDERQTYQINLIAGQYVNVMIEQRGIDIAATLYDPSGKKIMEVDSRTGPVGIEPLYLITEAGGSYRLEIIVVDKAIRPAKYQVKLATVRAANAADATRIAGYKLVSEADPFSLTPDLKKLEQALKLFQQIDDQLAEATALDALSQYYLSKDDLEKAEQLCQRTLTIREKLLGAESLESTISLDTIGDIYQNRSDYKKAEPLLLRALAIRERLLGADHYDVAASLNKLAMNYYYQGDRVKAEPFFLRALAVIEQICGPEYIDIAPIINNLATLYAAKDEFAKAESLYQRALAIREQALGPEDSTVAISLNTLGLLYLTKGNYAKAEPLLLRALTIKEKTVGPDHTQTAEILSSLAGLYFNKGEYDKAELYSQRGLKIREKAYGPEHRAVAASLIDTAGIYTRRGNYKTAEDLYLRALAINEKLLGPDHVDVAQLLNNLATVYQFKSDYAKAESLFQRVIATYQKVSGPESANLASALNSLASLNFVRGDYEKAEQLHQRALEIREKLFGADNPIVAQSANNLGMVYMVRSGHAKAEKLFLRALETRKKVLGPNHLDTATTINNLAMLYSVKNDYEQAEKLLEQAIATYQQALGPESTPLSRSLNNLALIYEKSGDYQRAESTYQRALAMKEKIFGPGHPEVIGLLNNLATLYRAKGDIKQAIETQSRANERRERDLERNLIAGSEGEKLNYLQLAASEKDRMLSLHLQAAPEDREAAQLALTMVLSRKGRSLDAMTDAIGKLRQRANPEDQKLFDQLAIATSEFSALTLRGPSKNDAEQYRARLQRLAETIDNLEADIGARNIEFRAQYRAITLANIQKALPADTTLVEFATYRPFDPQSGKYAAPHYAVYLLNSDGNVRWAELGETAMINSACAEFRSLLFKRSKTGLSNIEKELKPVARAVDQMVMQPVRRLLDDRKHLLISPDGLLNIIPFDALVDEQKHYLVENYQISYLTSGRDLLRFQNPFVSDQPAVIVADPDYGKGAGPILAGRKFPPLNRLNATTREAQQINSTLTDAVLELGSAATEQALKAVDRPSILHIATHGYFLPNTQISQLDENSGNSRNLGLPPVKNDVEQLRIVNPLLRSCLFLAGANNSSNTADNNDNILTALEAAGLNLFGTKLVVLSACETGLGEVKDGDGVYGLRRALVLAGAETQLISLWSVDDEATREIMSGYYRLLKAGESRAAALRKMQLNLLNSSKPRHTGKSGSSKQNINYQHPYYWASFIQSGEWRALEGKR